MRFRIASIFLTRESEILRHYILRASAVTNGAPRETSLFPGIGDGCTPPYTITIPPEEGVSADDFAQLCGALFNPYCTYSTSYLAVLPGRLNISENTPSMSTRWMNGRLFCVSRANGAFRN